MRGSKRKTVQQPVDRVYKIYFYSQVLLGLNICNVISGNFRKTKISKKYRGTLEY